MALYGSIFLLLSDDTQERSLLHVTGKIAVGDFPDLTNWPDINGPTVESNLTG